MRSPFGRTLTAILMAFTLIPIVILTAISLYNLHSQLQERALTQAATIGDLTQQTIAQWVGEASSQLTSTLKDAAIAQNSSFILLSTTTDVSRAEQVLSKQLGVLTNTAYFSETYLIRTDDSIALASRPDLKGQKIGIGLAQLDQQGKHFWGFDKLSTVNQDAAFIWQAVLDQRQQVIGFLVGQINIKGLSAVLQKNAISLGQTGEIYLVDQTQLPLTDLRLADASSQPKLSLNLASKHTFSGLFLDYANRPVVGTAQPLQNSLDGWLIVHEQQSEAFATYDALIRIIVVMTVILIGAALFMAIFTTQWIIEPLRRLTGAAQSMTGGNLAVRVDVKRQDEFGILSDAFNSMAVKLEETFNALDGTVKKLAARADQLAAITRVGQHATSSLELEGLLPMLTHEIQHAFGYYAVVLYLPDQLDSAVLIGKAAAGTAAEDFMAMLTHRTIDYTSLVGTAASSRQTVSVPDVAKDKRYAPHPLRPATKSEVSIPLLVSTDLIGVLDIQSDVVNAFGQEELEILQILANQIGIAIRNAELFGEATIARQVADEANRQKSEFLSNMSHELRTPLNVIIGYSHSIINRPAMYNNVPLPSVYEEGMRNIMNGGQHLMGLINDILDLSKIEAGQIDLDIQPIDPLPVLHGVRATALGLIKGDVTLRADYPETLPDILGDELRIRQILLNLVSNAAKFTEHGFITLNAQVKDNHLLFSVADTGVGIPADAQRYLFDRFRQAERDTTRKYGGSGLGLSISRQLCVMHGGEIWFESQVGQGTTFFFTIPLAKETDVRRPRPISAGGWDERSARAEIFAEPTETLLRQVLLIDTQPDSRSKLRAALIQAQYDVISADDAERGVEMAEAVEPSWIVINTHPGDPAAIMDLNTLFSHHTELSTTPILVLNDAKDAEDTALNESLVKLSSN